MIHGTGARLRGLLHRVSWSPEQFANRLNGRAAQLGLPARVDKKTPYKWLRGAVPREPWPALAAGLLSERLDAEVRPEDLGWPVRAGGVLVVPATAGLDVPWTGAGTITATSEVAETSVLDRRVFLAVTGAAATQPALEWLIAKPADDVYRTVGRRVLDSHVDSIDQVTAQLRALDDQFGGGAVLDLVKSQVRFVLDLLRDRSYTTEVGTRLHGAAAELLRLAGYASWDAGQDPQAQRFWTAALHAAHTADDRAVGARILGLMSCQAQQSLDQHSEAVRLAEAARRGYPGGSARAQAVLDFHTASAYGKAGAAKECHGMVHTAMESARSIRADDADPAWAYWLDEAQAHAEAGYAYERLGDWSRAQGCLKSALRLRGQQGSFPRQDAETMVKLGLVQARMGEPDQACAAGNQVVDVLVGDVASDRTVGWVRQLEGALAPYRKVPAVREFRERADQLVRTASAGAGHPERAQPKRPAM